MEKLLRIAVESQSEKDLSNFLNFKGTTRFNSNLYDPIEKALVGRWHSQHEDLVNIIYLKGLKDDRFIEPILDIAFNREIFRWYDD